MEVRQINQWPWKRLSLFMGIGLMAIIFGCVNPKAGGEEKGKVELRGMGTVNVSSRFFGEGAIRSSWITFSAEDAGHSTVIGSKFMADLLGFGDIKQSISAGLPGTVLELDGSGLWLLGLEDYKCHILFARNGKDLGELVEKANAANWKPIPPKAYPRWLDCFDNAGTGTWWGGGGAARDIPGDFQWAKERRFTLAAQPPSNSRYVAPGVLDTSITDWFAATMKQYDIPYRTYLWPSLTAASWNYEPLPYITPAALKVFYPNLHLQAYAAPGQLVPVGGTETPAATDRYLQDFQRRFAKELNTDPNFVGGCMVVSENCSASILSLAMAAGMPEIKDLWHRYLKDELGLDLQKTGLLHKGRKDFYRSWNEVKVPEPQDFLGYDARCLDLVGVWEGHADLEKAGVTAKWYTAEGAPKEGWNPTHCNDPMLLIYGGAINRSSKGREKTPDYWLRKTITLNAEQASALKYMHISRNTLYDVTAYTPLFDVYINGEKLKKVSIGDHEAKFSQCSEVGNALKAGENQVVINTLGCPVPGYIFLGHTLLRDYPYMAEAENRLWFDAINFDTWLKMRSYENTLRAFRTADPNRPLKLAATINLLDGIIPLCEKYGAYPHDTGGSGSYWCPMFGARLGAAHGLPYSCEQGGPPPTVAAMQTAMTYYLMYGDHAVDLVFSSSAYRKETNPEVGAWVDNNLELMHCIGKMDLPLPSIAILRSTRACRLGFGEPWNWDLGRGALQSTGRNFAYLEVPDITNGMINKFPVVIDDGTVLLTDEDNEGIKRYVRNGGIFVAQHHTGRHSPSQANTWALAKAWGLTITPRYMSDENFHKWPLAKMRFMEDEDLLPSLRGKEIEGSGAMISYSGKEYSGAVSINGKGEGVRPVALWADNGAMAIADVREGRGRFILLGTPFYQRMRDMDGHWIFNDERSASLLDEFLSSLGVPRDSWTGDRNIWAEHWASKNGVYDLYPVVRMVPKGDEKTSATVSLRRTVPLGEVVEISANGHPRLPVAWKDGKFTLPETPYGLMQFRMYAAPSVDLDRAALRWFDVQKKIWRALPPIQPPDKTEAVKMPKDVLPLAEDWRMSTGQTNEDWIQSGFNASDWKTVKLGAFASMGLPEDAVAQFTKEISIPTEWKGQRIQLVFNAEDWFWGIGMRGRLWINGKPAAIRQPLQLGAVGSFLIELTPEQLESKVLSIALEVDGRLSDPKKPRGHPSGVTGIFYLQAMPRPVAVTALSEPWFSAGDVNVLTEVKVGKPARFTYLETHFTLPKDWPGKRVFLESPAASLGWFILNNQVVSTPPHMRSLDISGLIRKNGENILRWAPNEPNYSSKFNQSVPELRLSWLP
ncbi:MAG: hypothetical protein WAX69_07295 [Victivallales bacterium]